MQLCRSHSGVLMDALIISNPVTTIILSLLVGLFIGYALSRKQQDKPIIEMPPVDHVLTSDTELTPWDEALREPDPKGKRIGTVE